MPNQPGSLWPVVSPGEIRTPVQILREQAAFLAESTGNVLEGRVQTRQDEDNFSHTFFIAAPALNNFKYALLKVNHPVTLYPLIVFDYNDPIEKPSPLPAFTISKHGRMQQSMIREANFAVRSEEEFMAILQQIFSSEKTIMILRVLMSQSRS